MSRPTSILPCRLPEKLGVTLLHLGLSLAVEKSHNLQGLKPRHHKSHYSAQLKVTEKSKCSKPNEQKKKEPIKH